MINASGKIRKQVKMFIINMLWWRRRESVCFSVLKTNKLLEIYAAQNAPNARYAALKYVRSTWALTLLKSSAKTDNCEHRRALSPVAWERVNASRLSKSRCVALATLESRTSHNLYLLHSQGNRSHSFAGCARRTGYRDRVGTGRGAAA